MFFYFGYFVLVYGYDWQEKRKNDLILILGRVEYLRGMKFYMMQSRPGIIISSLEIKCLYAIRKIEKIVPESFLVQL